MTNQDGSVYIIQYKTLEDEASNAQDQLQDSIDQTKFINQENPNVGYNPDKEILNSFISGASCLTGVKKN